MTKRPSKALWDRAGEYNDTERLDRQIDAFVDKAWRDFRRSFVLDPALTYEQYERQFKDGMRLMIRAQFDTNG